MLTIIFSPMLSLIPLLLISSTLATLAAAAGEAPANSPQFLCGTFFVTRYNERIARAEEVIKKYIHDKYALDESLYHIRMNAKNTAANIICFLISHQDDEHPAAPGGGKSFLIDFDMHNMRIVRELRF